MFEAAATRFLIAKVIALPRAGPHNTQCVPTGTKHFEPSVDCKLLCIILLYEQHCEIQTQRATAGIPLTKATLDTMSFDSCMYAKCSAEIRPSRPATRRLLGGCLIVTWGFPPEPDLTPAESQGRVRVSAAGFPKPGHRVMFKAIKDGSGVFKYIGFGYMPPPTNGKGPLC